MRDLIPVIEAALGPSRLAALKRNEDQYQDFWLGVLEAYNRVDWDRDAIAYLITSGYGAVRNAKRSGWTADRFRHCPACGKVQGYRAVRCSRCGAETQSEVRHHTILMEPESGSGPDRDLRMTIEQFVETLSGNRRYIAKRWMLDRADLLYQNYSKQLAFELGISAPRVAQIVSRLKRDFQVYLNR